MAGETTTPLLPCASIDEITAFYEALGFRTTYRQRRPNGYAIVARDDVALHFFSIDGFNPADSYGSCLVGVPDAGALYAAFRDGLRSLHGSVPLDGIPRLTRFRRKDGGGGTFSLIDPGGNWIRVHQHDDRAGATSDPASPESARPALGKALDAALTLGESKGDHATAAKLLDTALARAGAPVPEQIAALVYRAELALRLGDHPGAARHLDRVRAIPLDDDARAAAHDDLTLAAELDQRLTTGD